MNRKWIIAILVYIGLIALCCIVVYAVPSVRDKLEKTYIAQNGTIDVKDEVSAFIVRDEYVYVAAQKSKINRLAETDKLVRGKARIVELTPDESEEEAQEAENAAATETGESKDDKTADSKDKKTGDSKDTKSKDSKDAKTDDKADAASKEPEPAEDDEETADTGRYNRIMEELGDNVKATKKGVTRDAGYVSYYVDGAEARLSTDAIDGLTEQDLKELTGRRAIKVPSKRCGKGYPIFKIVKNSKWYLVYFLDNEDAAKYAEGDTVSIDINGEPVTVTVSRIDSGTKTSKIILSCKSFFDGFLEIRNLRTTVTIVEAEGLVLEDSSIVEAPDGKRGVFVKNKLGEHVFKPIRAKADNGTKCVVYSDIYVDTDGNFVETIRTYDEIIAEPSEDDIASLSKKDKKKDSEKNDKGSEEKKDEGSGKKDDQAKDSKAKDTENKDTEKNDSADEKSEGN